MEDDTRGRGDESDIGFKGCGKKKNVAVGVMFFFFQAEDGIRDVRT